MDRILDSQKDEVKKMILQMGGFVERSLDQVTHSLRSNDTKGLNEVFETEKKINGVHLDVDRVSMHFFAKNAPVAADLRFMLSLIKINNDLERMGDQTVNIAHLTRDYLKVGAIHPLPVIGPMTEAVKEMVKDVLDSFVTSSIPKAQQVLMADDKVDSMKDEMFQKMVQLIKQKPGQTEAALALILIARNLERLADHATNIAEDVIFAVSGEDIRHGSKRIGNADTKKS